MENLGVSQSAVSCALSQDVNLRKQISSELRDRIIKEAKRLNYKPRRFKKTRTKNIALLDSQNPTSYCHPLLVRSVQACALKSSYLLNHCFYDQETGVPDELLDNIDGIISLELLSTEEFSAIKSRNIPVVLLNAYDGTNDCDIILPDHYAGLKQAVNCLYKLGHRRFAFFGIRDFGPHHAQRYGAFHQIIAELDISDQPAIFIPYRKEQSMLDVEDKAKATLRAIAGMKNKPTALICAVDSYALAIIKYAADFGIRIPEDLSVIGFDDTVECETATPSLSSITLSLEAMGQVATGTLIRRINGDADPFVTIKVDLDWIARDSIAPPSS